MASALELLKTFSPYAPSIVNGILQRRSIGGATNKLTGGVDRARDITTRTGEELQNIYQPWMKAGQDDLNTIQTGLGEGGEFNTPFTGDDLQNEPGYQFGLNQGQQALDAARRALGTKMSGGAVKEGIRYQTDYASTKFNDAFQRDRQNQTDRYNRLKGVVDTGADATARAGQAKLITGAELADLESQRAEAEAQGDVGKADSLTNAINSGLKVLDAAGGLGKVLGGLGTKAATTGGALAVVAGGGASLGTAGTTGAIGTLNPGTGALVLGSGAPATAAGAAGAAPLTGYAGGGLVTSHGAMVGMMTNPITIAVAAGIIGVTALLKSQAHWEANTWVQGFQNKFDKNMDQINRQFQSAAQSGQMSKQDALQVRGEVQEALNQYEAKRQEFAKGGKDEKKVAGQALDTFNQWYGPQGSKTLSQMDQIIARLA